MAVGDSTKPVAPSVRNGPAPAAPNPFQQQANVAGNYYDTSSAFADQAYQNQANQLQSGLNFANQSLGLNQGYTQNTYGLQSQNLSNTLASQLFSNLLQRYNLELGRQGITSERGTAYRNFDWQKLQSQNQSAARGSFGTPGHRQQEGQYNAQLLDTLKDLGRRWSGLDIQGAGISRGEKDIKSQSLIQQAMLKLSKDYQMSQGNLGFNQQLANAGFQQAGNLINLGQQRQNLLTQILSGGAAATAGSSTYIPNG